MNSYFLIVLADILLAVILVCQKKYQEKAGTSAKASLKYTILSGVFSALIFLVINGFTINVTLFSIGMATLFSVMLTIYVFIGFGIMKNGNISLYTLFLMSGGMVIPYVYGVLFLEEKLNFARILGLILILAAIVLFNLNKVSKNKKQLVLCFLVFLLNGAVSALSKAHQVSVASLTVSSSDFVFLVSISKIVISLLVFPFLKGEGKEETKVPIKSVIWVVFVAAAADGLSYMLQLMGAVKLPATVLYPLVTGGTIILSSLVDLVLWKQRFSKKQYISVAIAFLGTLLFL